MLLLVSQLHITVKNTLLLLFLILAGFFFTVYIYRKTIPPVPLFFKRILTGLRIAAILLLLFVIFELSINLIKTRQDRPHIAVAVDTSASMSVRDDAGLRSEIAARILQNPVFAKFNDNFIINYYSFANITQSIKLADSISFSGDATNIMQCLQFIKKELSEKNLAAIVMLSDGNYNRGGNPVRIAEQLGTPVYTIGLGSAEPVRDIGITEVVNNPFSYLDESTPIEVTIHNSGYQEIGLPVTLTVNNELIETQMLNLPAAPSEAQTRFNFIPKTTGMNKLVISVPAQSNELLVQNNSRTIYMDVLKSKLFIHLYAGSLSPDISFLKNNIASTERYTVGAWVEKSGGGFYPNDNNTMDEADILIFLDFPTSQTDQGTLNRLSNSVTTKATPVLVITGKNTNLAKLTLFENWLPFKCNAGYINEIQIYADPSDISKNHPIMQPVLQNASVISAWSKLPPIFTVHQFNQLWPDTQTLAFAKTARAQQNSKSANPLIIIRSNDNQKSAAILGYGLWRWELLMWGIGEGDDIYNSFINNMLRWLETKKETSSWQIKTDKQQYNFGEPIKIVVEITDKTIAMPQDAELTLQLSYNQVSEPVTVTRSGEKNYSATIYLDKAGDYKLTFNTNPIPQSGNTPANALFSIGEYSIELNNTQLQNSTLQDLSANTGGQYITPDSVSVLGKLIHGAPKTSTQALNRELWNNQFVLYFIIFFLTVEWFLRKKRGML